MIRRVNLFGGPGIGKSTFALNLTAKLKRLGIVAEYVPEAIKPWAYEGKVPDEFDQGVLFYQQLQAEKQFLGGGVEIVVNDSPLLLNCFYSRFKNAAVSSGLMDVAELFEHRYKSVSIMLTRPDSQNYLCTGRYQGREEATKLDNLIFNFLYEKNITTYGFYPSAVIDACLFIQDERKRFLRGAIGTSGMCVTQTIKI